MSKMKWFHFVVFEMDSIEFTCQKNVTFQSTKSCGEQAY